MLKLPTKFLIVIEILICFGPAAIFLWIGARLIPNQFADFDRQPIDWYTRISLIGQVTCGLIGLFTLVYVVSKLFSNSKSINHPTLVCTGVALGLLPLSPAILPDSPFRWIGLLPIAATIHILFLSRRILFKSYKEAVKSLVISAAVALSLPFALDTFQFGSSETELAFQKDIWMQKRPIRYEYILQLSGWYPPDMLSPKRISVANGEIVSATYAWTNNRHKEGDLAPADMAWTMERVFDEMLEAERQGFTILARYNQDFGYVESAHVDSDQERSGWSIQIREFQDASSN